MRKLRHPELRWPLKALLVAVSLAWAGAVAAADFKTGYTTAVSLLYLVPIVGCVWLTWPAAAVTVALLCGASDVIVGLAASHGATRLQVTNSVTQTAFFLVLAAVCLALKASQSRLHELSRTDPLTGLKNRRSFFESGDAEAQRAVRYKRTFSIVYIDVDDFKRINDALGHRAGDALLRRIAEQVRAAVRRTDVAARLGGDEFAVLLPETDAGAASKAVASLRQRLTGLSSPDGRPVTFSLGVLTSSGRPCAFDELVSAADSLMYESKRGGKDSVRFGVAA